MAGVGVFGEELGFRVVAGGGDVGGGVEAGEGEGEGEVAWLRGVLLVLDMEERTKRKSTGMRFRRWCCRERNVF